MNALDFRIGNYLMSLIDTGTLKEGSIFKIIKIEPDGINLNTSYDLPGFEWFTGVPLSNIILDKTGFEDTYADGVFYFDRFKYKTESKDLWFDTTSIEIEYLHQLQNLYFALTGNELEIQW